MKYATFRRAYDNIFVMLLYNELTFFFLRIHYKSNYSKLLRVNGMNLRKYQGFILNDTVLYIYNCINHTETSLMYIKW